MPPQVRPLIPSIILGLLIAYFGVQGLTGERGLLASQARAEALAERRLELARLTAQRNDLKARVRLLRTDNLSADLLEERARALLGFADPRDVIVRLPPEREPTES